MKSSRKSVVYLVLIGLVLLVTAGLILWHQGHRPDSARPMVSARPADDVVVRKEVEKIVADARQNALMGAARIEDEARDEAHRIVKRAEEEAALEKSRAMDELKSEIIAIASMMAGKVVSANIDTSVQEELLDETLREMGESTWRSK